MLGRREFLKNWLAVLGLVGAAGCSDRSRPRRRRRVVLAPLSDIKPGLNKFGLVRVAVLRDSRGLACVSLTCTHQICALVHRPQGSAVFLCPCHGSNFDRRGEALNGPATQRLPWYRLMTNERQELEVDLNVDMGPDWRFNPEA